MRASAVGSRAKPPPMRLGVQRGRAHARAPRPAGPGPSRAGRSAPSRRATPHASHAGGARHRHRASDMPAAAVRQARAAERQAVDQRVLADAAVDRQRRDVLAQRREEPPVVPIAASALRRLPRGLLSASRRAERAEVRRRRRAAPPPNLPDDSSPPTRQPPSLAYARDASVMASRSSRAASTTARRSRRGRRRDRAASTRGVAERRRARAAQRRRRTPARRAPAARPGRPRGRVPARARLDDSPPGPPARTSPPGHAGGGSRARRPTTRCTGIALARRVHAHDVVDGDGRVGDVRADDDLPRVLRRPPRNARRWSRGGGAPCKGTTVARRSSRATAAAQQRHLGRAGHETENGVRRVGVGLVDGRDDRRDGVDVQRPVDERREAVLCSSAEPRERELARGALPRARRPPCLPRSLRAARRRRRSGAGRTQPRRDYRRLPAAPPSSTRRGRAPASWT